LIFSITPIDKARPEILYFNLAHTFSNTLDKIGMGDREDENQLEEKLLTFIYGFCEIYNFRFRIFRLF
jgi:hypothetical protein